jgi:hypothetical protein
MGYPLFCEFMFKARSDSFFRRIKFGLLVLTAATFMTGTLPAQETNRKAVVELVYSSPTWLARFRPCDYTWPSGIRQWNLLIGRRWGGWNTYLYWKADNRDRSWMGTRVETRLEGWEGRLNAVLQGRAFLGLNRDSPRHGYLITCLLYRLDSGGKINAGLLSLGKISAEEAAVFYWGPCLTLQLHRHMTVRLSYGPDWLGEGGLLYLKLYLHL